MDTELSSLLALVPYVALVVAVNVGGLAAKRLWSALAASGWRPLRLLGRAALDTMRYHPDVVGMGLAVVPGLLTGPLVQRLAIGLVLGEFAETIYRVVKGYLDARAARRASRPPEPAP